MLSPTLLGVEIIGALQSFQEDAIKIHSKLIELNKVTCDNFRFLPILYVGAIVVQESGTTTATQTITLHLPKCLSDSENTAVHGSDVEKIKMLHAQMNTTAEAYFEKKKLAKKPPIQEFGK